MLSIKIYPHATAKQLNSSLQMLKEIVLPWSAESGQLASQIKASVDVLGRSLESILLEQSQNPNFRGSEKSLLSLVKLQQLLKRDGKNDLADAVDKFLGDIRQNQLMNVKPDPVPGRGEWSEIGFLLQRALQEANDNSAAARLRIAHEAGQRFWENSTRPIPVC